MNKAALIKQLNSSKLIAECNLCGEEFRLSQTILFDGLGEFPELAEQKRLEMEASLKQQLADLKKRKISTGEAEQDAIAVGFGKIIEKVAPAYREFKIPSTDCRALFDPIDLVVFNGVTNRKVHSITFLDIKTGNARLNCHERLVRDAVEDGDVRYRIV